MVCRIIGLHPATSPGEEAKITVNYYLRRRDVTNRNLADHRIVFATFMVGTVPLSHVRSRCRVMYRDFLEDPEGTKRLDDCFIFFQVGATADRRAFRTTFRHRKAGRRWSASRVYLAEQDADAAS